MVCYVTLQYVLFVQILEFNSAVIKSKSYLRFNQNMLATKALTSLAFRPSNEKILARAITGIINDQFLVSPKIGYSSKLDRTWNSINLVRSLNNTPQRQNFPKTFTEEKIADHSWRQLNHIWSDGELEEQMATKDVKHIPVTSSDKIMNGIMKLLYNSFNTITGYKHDNPSTKSIEWRLIVLESFAGVPGFLAAAFRHFYSLRTLERDHGSIYTFLEEAENERMHLLVCLKMFEASTLTRALVVGAQIGMTPFLMGVYTISPPAMHRFVGYLEETAVETYSNIIKHAETEGTHLNKSWAHLEAPAIAKTYWQLADDASWITCLKHILADEAHHRDVNHTFAELPANAENPFISEHMKNFDEAVMRRTNKILQNALLEKQTK